MRRGYTYPTPELPRGKIDQGLRVRLRAVFHTQPLIFRHFDGMRYRIS